MVQWSTTTLAPKAEQNDEARLLIFEAHRKPEALRLAKGNNISWIALDLGPP
jgi:hypothetical protein